MPGPPAIQTNDLTKRFGDVTAVDEVNLRVERGEVFGFLGPNGAGKSTTINVLLDFVTPTAGSAEVLGHDVHADREAVHQRIGVVPEDYGLYDRLSGRRHLELAVELKNANDDPARLLDRVGLSPSDADRPAGEYSTGMAQRLALGIALVGDPDLLILDEPTSGLDPNGARELRELVRSEADSGTTVFFSSHVLAQVRAVADRVGIANEGELVAVDTVDGLRSELGVGARVTLTLADGENAGDGVGGVETERLRERFADDGEITDVETSGGEVRATCLEPAAKLRFVDGVRETATATDLQVSESSLEDLFASYTGADGPETVGTDADDATTAERRQTATATVGETATDPETDGADAATEVDG